MQPVKRQTVFIKKKKPMQPKTVKLIIAAVLVIVVLVAAGLVLFFKWDDIVKHFNPPKPNVPPAPKPTIQPPTALTDAQKNLEAYLKTLVNDVNKNQISLWYKQSLGEQYLTEEEKKAHAILFEDIFKGIDQKNTAIKILPLYLINSRNGIDQSLKNVFIDAVKEVDGKMNLGSVPWSSLKNTLIKLKNNLTDEDFESIFKVFSELLKPKQGVPVQALGDPQPPPIESPQLNDAAVKKKEKEALMKKFRLPLAEFCDKIDGNFGLIKLFSALGVDKIQQPDQKTNCNLALLTLIEKLSDQLNEIKELQEQPNESENETKIHLQTARDLPMEQKKEKTVLQREKNNLQNQKKALEEIKQAEIQKEIGSKILKIQEKRKQIQEKQQEINKIMQESNIGKKYSDLGHYLNAIKHIVQALNSEVSFAKDQINGSIESLKNISSSYLNNDSILAIVKGFLKALKFGTDPFVELCLSYAPVKQKVKRTDYLFLEIKSLCTGTPLPPKPVVAQNPNPVNANPNPVNAPNPNQNPNPLKKSRTAPRSNQSPANQLPNAPVGRRSKTAGHISPQVTPSKRTKEIIN